MKPATIRVVDEYVNDELLNRIRYDYMGKQEAVEKTDRNYYNNGVLKLKYFILMGRRKKIQDSIMITDFLKINGLIKTIL